MGGVCLWWFLCVLSGHLLDVLGLESHDVSACDPEFKAAVEGCLDLLQGFPVLGLNKSLLDADWVKTDVICRRQLVHSSTRCVRREFARCPETRVWRSLCGFQHLHPDLLLRYGLAVCSHKEVLEQHWGCQGEEDQCRVKTCLSSYRAAMPSALTVGMYKGHRHSALCKYQAYAEFCHESISSPDCPGEFHDARQDIFNASRPLSCSDQEMDLHRSRYRENQILLEAINSAATCGLCYTVLVAIVVIVAIM